MAIGLATVFIATFMLFYVFYNIEKISERCRAENLPVCERLSPFTLSMLAVLLIVAGFIVIIYVTAYILLFPKA